MNQTTKIPVKWLTDAPKRPTGVTWGVPWAKGELQRTESLALLRAEGASLPMQSWPTAFWPDGSVKWTAHAAAVPADESRPSRTGR